MTARSVHMELLLLSNSTDYGRAMFSHAAEAFVDSAIAVCRRLSLESAAA